MRTKVLIISFWLTLVGALAFAIRHADAPPTPEIAIATLVDARADTLFRPADFLLWHPAAAGQALGDGDYVATGKRGGATLRFADGRTLRLGPDTILIVTREKSGKDALYTLNLVQGQVVDGKAAPHAPGKSAPAVVNAPFLIKVGEKVIELTPRAKSFAIARRGQSLSINAPPQELRIRDVAQKKARQLTSNVTILRLKETPAPTLQALMPRMSLAAKPQTADKKQVFAPPPLPEPPPAKAPQLTGPGQMDIVKIASPQPDLMTAAAPAPSSVQRPRLLPRDRRFWTLAPFDAALPRLETSWMLTSANRDVGSEASAQLRCAGKLAGEILKPVPQRGTLVLRGTALTTGMTATPRGRTIGCNAVVLSAGEVVAKSDDVSLKLRSLAAFAQAPATIVLRTLRRQPLPPGKVWAADAGEVPTSEAAATLYLHTGGQLTALAPWLNGANGFSVKAVPLPDNGEAYRFVRQGRIVATLKMQDGRLPAARQMARDLQADLLYYGSAADMMSAGDASSRRAWLTAMATAKRSVFVLDGELFAEVDPQFLLSRIEAQQFVEGRSTAWFTKPVQVIR